MKKKKKKSLERSIVARVMRYHTMSEVHRSEEKIVVDPREAPLPPLFSVVPLISRSGSATEE